MIRFLVLLLLCWGQSMYVQAQECVVLLHGLGRTAWSMRQIESTLQKAGYLVVNQNYLSREKSIADLAQTVGDGITACEKHNPTAIHFVTHSLGGVLVRAYFQNRPAGLVRRVVMLGPPNRGSEVVDRFRDSWWFKWLTGPAGQQLGTGADSIPNQLKPISLDIGIIAGRSSSDPWFTSLFNGANDGKVSVASTRLDEMKDFIQVDNGHTFMANSRNVIGQIQTFLASGAFAHDTHQLARTN